MEAAVASGFFQTMGAPAPLDEAQREAVRRVMALCDLRALAGRTFGQLSYGQTRRVLLARALVTSEGVGRQLDPEFNMAETARPLVERVLRERLSPGALAQRAGELAHDAAEVVQTLPRGVLEIIEKLRNDRFQIQFVHRNLEHFVHEMDRSSNRLSLAILVAALIVGSSLIFQAKSAGPAMFGYPALGITGFLAAGLLGLWLVVLILRSGRF